MATPLYPDHVLLELSDGMVQYCYVGVYRRLSIVVSMSLLQIRFVFDNGPGEEVVEYRPPIDTMLCDGQWHSIAVEKDGETGYLSIDGGDRLFVTSAFSNFLAVDTNHPLYVGGVPGECNNIVG